MRIDASMHSLFGASKVASRRDGAGVRPLLRPADRLLPRRLPHGPAHSAAELHGFLAYIARAIREGRVPDYGYGGKQVRDNIHAHDVCTAMMAYAGGAAAGAVYNLGGGRANSISVLEAIAAFEDLIGERLATESVDEPRRGDHVATSATSLPPAGRLPGLGGHGLARADPEELARAGAPAVGSRRPVAAILVQTLAVARTACLGLRDRSGPVRTPRCLTETCPPPRIHGRCRQVRRPERPRPVSETTTRPRRDSASPPMPIRPRYAPRRSSTAATSSGESRRRARSTSCRGSSRAEVRSSKVSSERPEICQRPVILGSTR